VLTGGTSGHGSFTNQNVKDTHLRLPRYYFLGHTFSNIECKIIMFDEGLDYSFKRDK